MRFLLICLVVIFEVQSLMSYFLPKKTSWKYYNNSHRNPNDEDFIDKHSQHRRCFLQFHLCHENSEPLSYKGTTDDPTMTETPQKLKNLFKSNFLETFVYKLPPTSNYTVAEVPDELAIPIVEDFEKKHSFVNDSQSRIGPFNFFKTKQTKRQKYPTIRLAQIVRKIIFPDWIWKGSGIKRKVGMAVSNISSSASGAQNEVLQLFTVVQFNNTPCVGSNGRSGICYHSKECSTFGGSGSIQCAGGLGICCIFSIGCGNRSTQNGTYFVDGGMTYNVTGIETCSIEIQKLNPRVRQIRLDFEVFSLQQPTAGNCDRDRFVVLRQNTNNVIPILCGDNNGTHIYVETWGTGNVQLSVMTRGAGVRRWRIRITQYDTTSDTRSPSHCLQFETAVMGSINSFNYNSATTPQYLNNLNYAICIQKATGFCSVTYTNRGFNGTYTTFQVVNANENGHLVIPSGHAGVGMRDCPFDYILINGNRLCGDRFNDGFVNRFLIVDAPVTDFSSGPFILTVQTNELDVGGGFLLYYRLNPCLPMLTSG